MGGGRGLIRLFLFALILILTVMWFTISEGDKGRPRRRGKGNVNKYRLEYIYGEIAKKLSLGRGKLRELTMENVNLFALKYDNTDIFWSALGYRSLNEELYDSPRWGDAYFVFKASIDDISSEKEISLLTAVLRNAQEFVTLLVEKYRFPEWAVRPFFTGDGFDILISAAAMGVEPRGDLCQIYKEFRDYMVREHQIEYLEDDVYGYRAMIRCPNTINSRMSGRVPRYKIELTWDEFMSLSVREMDLISRRPRESKYPYDFDHRVSDTAHLFYSERVAAYERRRIPSGFLPLPQNGNGYGLSDALRPCVKRMLQDGVAQEQVVEAAMAIAMEYRRLKYPQDMALNQLKKWLEREGMKGERSLPPPESFVVTAYGEDEVRPIVDLCESNGALMTEKCIGRDECSYFVEIQLEKEREKLHDEALFELKGWPTTLGPIRSAVYRAVVAFEGKNAVPPGKPFVIVLDELAAYVGLSTGRLSGKYLQELKSWGLLTECMVLEGGDGKVKVQRRVPIPSRRIRA